MYQCNECKHIFHEDRIVLHGNTEHCPKCGSCDIKSFDPDQDTIDYSEGKDE